MEKLKVTKAQLAAVNAALDHYNGDADYLLVCHRNLMADGGQWVLWPELNTLNATQLRQVLKNSYEVVTTPVKIVRVGEDMPKRNIQVTRIEDIEQRRKQMLLVDIDYQLASLHDAMQRNDQVEIDKCKEHLKEIQEELEVQLGGITMPVYQNVDELRSKYSPLKTVPNFTLESHHFKFAGTTANGVLRTRKYRCEKEQLNIYIDLISDVILSVTAKYEVGDTDAKAS